MNDYTFGNKITALRTAAGLSQKELAAQLSVSDKAVSKWENGYAKPEVDTLKKLALYFQIGVDDLLDTAPQKKSPAITKLVITGGPCAGKSTALSHIQTAFSQYGYTVLFVAESATELITGGVAPWTCANNFEFQKNLLRLQLEKEKIYEAAAANMDCEKVLIVCDRGALDSKVYMREAEFSLMLAHLGLNEVELRDNYDCVFHLVSAAKGAQEYYTTANNAARTETLEEAAALDDKFIYAWTGHPHFRVIDNSTDFAEKINRLIAEISAYLGEPEPYEIERKFLIEYPDIACLESNPKCKKVEIIQTYLTPEQEGDELRIRQRGENGNYIYFKTLKRKVSGAKRVEIEHRLSKEEYLALLMRADTGCKKKHKNRYCLTYNNQYFEIDVYPFWSDKAICEIELKSENERIDFPPMLHIIKEVTDDEAYKNASLAKGIPTAESKS